MNPIDENAQRWIRLDVELSSQMDHLARLTREVGERKKRFGRKKPTTDEILALGKWMHDFYLCVERLMIRIAQDLNGGVPQSSDWHKRLLEQLSKDLPGIRPKVFSEDTVLQLGSFLRFRHLYRNIYALDLVWMELVPLLRKVAPLARQVAREVAVFRKFIGSLHSA